MSTSLEILLQAAMYLERRDTELVDHGYASPITSYHQRQRQQRRPKQRTTSWSSQGSGIRSLHNELEKNRRANLRNCLERLRDSIPAHGASTKNTTLQLLKRAKQHIMKLEEENAAFEQQRRKLQEQRRQLNEHISGKRRDSVGGSSVSSEGSSPWFGGASPQFDTDSVGSAPSVSDSDDVDITGSSSESDDVYGR
jgi:MAX dimerization protein